TALTAAPHKIAKYKQLLKTIDRLEPIVKDKDECLFTAVTCFQKGTLKLQPESSQVNSTFTQTIKALKRFTFNHSGKHFWERHSL
ncbi:hypothetical protein Q9233_012082, partial [Columba guinea]